MNEEETLAPDAWETLCQQQHARALAGDQQAAAWCAKHRPDALGGLSPTASTLAKFLTELDKQEPWKLGHAVNELPEGMALKFLRALWGTAYSEALKGLTREELQAIARKDDEDWAEWADAFNKILHGEGTRADLHKLIQTTNQIWHWPKGEDGVLNTRDLPSDRNNINPRINEAGGDEMDELLKRIAERARGNGERHRKLYGQD